MFITKFVSSDCDVYGHYATGRGTFGANLPPPTCGGVHRLGGQAGGAHGATGLHGQREREAQQADGDPATRHRASHHHLRQPEEGRRCAGQGPGEVRSKLHPLPHCADQSRILTVRWR